MKRARINSFEGAGNVRVTYEGDKKVYTGSFIPDSGKDFLSIFSAEHCTFEGVVTEDGVEKTLKLPIHLHTITYTDDSDAVIPFKAFGNPNQC